MKIKERKRKESIFFHLALESLLINWARQTPRHLLVKVHNDTCEICESEVVQDQVSAY